MTLACQHSGEAHAREKWGKKSETDRETHRARATRDTPSRPALDELAACPDAQCGTGPTRVPHPRVAARDRRATPRAPETSACATETPLPASAGPGQCSPLPQSVLLPWQPRHRRASNPAAAQPPWPGPARALHHPDAGKPRLLRMLPRLGDAPPRRAASCAPGTSLRVPSMPSQNSQARHPQTSMAQLPRTYGHLPSTGAAQASGASMPWRRTRRQHSSPWKQCLL